MSQQQYYSPLHKSTHTTAIITSIDLVSSTTVSNIVKNFLSDPYIQYRYYRANNLDTSVNSFWKYLLRIDIKSFIINSDLSPNFGMFYALKEFVRIWRARRLDSDGWLAWGLNNCLNAAMAGYLSSLIVYPMQIPKQVFLERKVKWRSVGWDKNGGSGGKRYVYMLHRELSLFYKDFLLASTSSSIQKGVIYGSFDTFKVLINNDFGSHFILATAGSILGTILNSPLRTVLKTKLLNRSQVKNNLQSFKKILKEEGAKGFFKGMRSLYWRSVFTGLIVAGVESVQFEVYPRLILY